MCDSVIISIGKLYICTRRFGKRQKENLGTIPKLQACTFIKSMYSIIVRLNL